MNIKYKLVEETIEKKDLITLTKWINSGAQLTKSNETLKFEKNFSNFLGTKNSIFVNSGSSANLLIASSLLQSNLLKNKKLFTLCFMDYYSHAVCSTGIRKFFLRL